MTTLAIGNPTQKCVAYKYMCKVWLLSYAENLVAVYVEINAKICERVKAWHNIAFYIVRYGLLSYIDCFCDFCLRFSALLYGCCKSFLYFVQSYHIFTSKKLYAYCVYFFLTYAQQAYIL